MDIKSKLKDPTEREKVRVGIIGCDKVSLNFAVSLCEAGFKPTILDINNVFNFLSSINEIFRDGSTLNRAIRNHMKAGKLTVTDSYKQLKENQLIFIFTPTRLDEKGKPDYTELERACRVAGDHLKDGSIVIISTKTFPGLTGSLLRQNLEDRSGLKAGLDFGLMYFSAVPKERPAMLGALNNYGLDFVSTLIEVTTGKKPLIGSSIKNVEAASYLEDLFGNVELALFNELTSLFERTNLDFTEIKRIMDYRLTREIPYPSLASKAFLDGSHIFIEEMKNLGVKVPIIKTATKINVSMPNHIFKLIRKGLKKCNKTLKRAKTLILGVSPYQHSPYESNTKALFDLLKKKGMKVQIFSPVNPGVDIEDSDFKIERDLIKCLRGKDCLILMEPNKGYIRLNLRKIKHFVNQPALIVDLVNEINPEEAEREGFKYVSFLKGVK